MLDETARQTLDLEAGWWRYAGTKEAAIRTHFDEEPAAYQHAPVLIRRLRRQRDRRLDSRSGRRLAG
jgi:hypothetical protein